MKLWFTTVVNPFEYSMLQINQDHFLQTDDDSNASGDKFMKMVLKDDPGVDDSFNNHHQSCKHDDDSKILTKHC